MIYTGQMNIRTFLRGYRILHNKKMHISIEDGYGRVELSMNNSVVAVNNFYKSR